jgi:hypothetical protein
MELKFLSLYAFIVLIDTFFFILVIFSDKPEHCSGLFTRLFATSKQNSFPFSYREHKAKA